MTWLLLLVSLAAAQDRGSAGLGAQVVGWQGSGRHLVQPALQGWVTLAPTATFAPTFEVMATHRADAGGVYRYAAWWGRVSGVVSWTAGTRATRLHAGLGPALSLRAGHLSSDAETFDRRPIRSVQGGVRARLALQGPLGPRLAGTWHVAATTRGLSVDYDTGLGLGVRW